MTAARLVQMVAAAAAALTLSVGQVAAARQSPSLEARLEALRQSATLPAVVGAVFRSDATLDSAAVGVRKLGDETPATTADLWHIGSVTKTFTSTLVARFVERGDFGWDSTLGDLLGPERAGAWAAVRVVDVLSHRAGLPANIPVPLTIEVAQSGAPVAEQRARLLDALLAMAPASAPGETFLYSNAGYILVGAMLEARTGRAWEDLVRDDVLTPLELTSAGFGPPGTPGAVTQPWGHIARPGQPLTPAEPGPTADNPPFLGPAGTLHMTVADLARWGQEHLRGERGRDGLITAASSKRLHTPPVNGADYALGWAVRAAGDQRVIWHNGSNTMWYAIVAFDPDLDLGVVLVTNGSIAAGRAVDAAAMQIVADWAGAYGN